MPSSKWATCSPKVEQKVCHGFCWMYPGVMQLPQDICWSDKGPDPRELVQGAAGRAETANTNTHTRAHLHTDMSTYNSSSCCKLNYMYLHNIYMYILAQGTQVMYVCMYVCMDVWMYVCVCVCVCMYVCNFIP